MSTAREERAKSRWLCRKVIGAITNELEELLEGEGVWSSKAVAARVTEHVILQPEILDYLDPRDTFTAVEIAKNILQEIQKEKAREKNKKKLTKKTTKKKS